MKTEDFIMLPIPVGMYTAICALIGGAATIAAPGGSRNSGATAAAPSAAAEPSSGGAEASPAANSGGTNAGGDTGEIDAHGHPWSAELHASTKGKTKDGLWRMKVGVSRPDPLPGFPKADASTDTGTSSATSQGATAQESAPTGTEDEDEFAAFRAAAAASDATDAAAAASVPARQYSDADLGALCNQAAVKLGDPSPIKEIIAGYVPEGQVAHSRNIPADKRADFVKAVEAKAGIEFAG